MLSYWNIIEELAIAEAKAQIDKLHPNIRPKLDISEVAAYALNRLPPMYATTKRGWLQHRQVAITELKNKIADSVSRAILGTQKDSLRCVSSLPKSELEDEAKSLAQLQKLLRRENLQWKDVPMAVETAITNLKIGVTVGNTYLSINKRDAIQVLDYLKRSKTNDITWKHRHSPLKASDRSVQVADDGRAFAAYMSSAFCNFRNTLERLVMSTAEREMQKLVTPSDAKQIKLQEVTAYTLNRLPPMYATSDRGLHHLRQRARSELARDIIVRVRQGIVIALKAPIGSSPPLPFLKIHAEQEQAMQELRQILHVERLTWRNVVEFVEDALARTQSDEIRLNLSVRLEN